MTIVDKIKILCVKSNVSISELSRRLGKTPQALGQKINRGTLSLDDLEDISIVLGCKLDCNIILPSGEKIKINS